MRFVTTSRPEQVTMTAVAEVASKRRWTTLTQGAGTVTFSYYKGPNKLLVFLLIIVVISIPLAILYIILARKHESLSVYAHASDGNVTQVQITSNGWRGKSASRAIRNRLAVKTDAAVAAVGAVPQPAAETPPAIAADPPSAIAASSPQAAAFCASCGGALPEATKFCGSCGAAVRA